VHGEKSRTQFVAAIGTRACGHFLRAFEILLKGPTQQTENR
jgi:hypothetical protein